ncbi:MAG: phage tail tube protein [Geminicoccaceae bacterium]|uniref:phage tail tube protein n=1 Tax=Reyranella sp. TaxID=1929291 RepID=UPI003D0DD06A
MDNALRQTAVVKETVWGTIPPTPAWKICRETRADGVGINGRSRSPERTPHRMAAAMVQENTRFEVSAEFAWARDSALDIWLEGLLCNAWATNQLKNASTIQPFAMEIKHVGATSVYRRFPGILVNTAQFAWRIGGPGTVSFTGYAKDHTTGTTAIASSTYASPTPGHDPVSSPAVLINNLCGVTGPIATAFNMTVTNSIDLEYGFGSDKPQQMPLGQFDVSGSFSFYLKALADYDAFKTFAGGQVIDFTIGSVANNKDQLQLPNLDVWNPAVPDKASRGSDEVTVNFMGKYYATDANAMKLIRNVA